MFSFWERKQINTQAKRDLEKKLRLERIFRPEIKRLFAKMNRDFKVRVAATGQPPSATKYQASWETALKQQYDRVQTVFKGSVDNLTQKRAFPIEETKLFGELLLLALLEWAEDRSITQSLFITRTNESNMIDAINQARQSLIEQELPTDNQSVANAASKILKRKTNGRISGIETLETQAPAESTKLFEARTKGGLRPTDAAPSDISKAWRTIGDSLVRTSPFSHKEANFQKVHMNDPFIVGGQSLMYPGDNSLGASIANTIN